MFGNFGNFWQLLAMHGNLWQHCNIVYRPAGQTSRYGPAGRTSWKDQLDGSVFYIWSLGQFPYLKIDVSVCTLLQLPSPAKALFHFKSESSSWSSGCASKARQTNMEIVYPCWNYKIFRCWVIPTGFLNVKVNGHHYSLSHGHTRKM